MDSQYPFRVTLHLPIPVALLFVQGLPTSCVESHQFFATCGWLISLSMLSRSFMGSVHQNIIFLFFCFSDRISLHSLDCPGAGSVDQAIIFKRPNGYIMLGPHILKRNALRRLSCCLFVADGLLCYEHWHSSAFCFPRKVSKPTPC